LLTVGKVLCREGEQLETHKKGCTRPQTAYLFCGTGAQEGMWQLAAFLQEKAHILIWAPLPSSGHCWRLCNLLQPAAHPLSISFLPSLQLVLPLLLFLALAERRDDLILRRTASLKHYQEPGMKMEIHGRAELHSLQLGLPRSDTQNRSQPLLQCTMHRVPMRYCSCSIVLHMPSDVCADNRLRRDQVLKAAAGVRACRAH